MLLSLVSECYGFGFRVSLKMRWMEIGLYFMCFDLNFMSTLDPVPVTYTRPPLWSFLRKKKSDCVSLFLKQL